MLKIIIFFFSQRHWVYNTDFDNYILLLEMKFIRKYPRCFFFCFFFGSLIKKFARGWTKFKKCEFELNWPDPSIQINPSIFFSKVLSKALSRQYLKFVLTNFTFLVECHRISVKFYFHAFKLLLQLVHNSGFQQNINNLAMSNSCFFPPVFLFLLFCERVNLAYPEIRS